MADIDTTGMTPEELQYLKDEGQIPADEPAEAEGHEEEPKAAETEQDTEPDPEAETATEGEEAKADDGGKDKAAEDDGGGKQGEGEDSPRRSKDDTIRRLRADRRELRGEVKDLRQFKETAQERLERLEQFRIKAEEPDKDLDPEAHARYQEQLQAERDAKAAEDAKQQETAAGLQELYDHVSRQEVAFATQNPDYGEVIKEAKDLAIQQEAQRLIDLDADESDAYEQAADSIEAALEAHAAEMKARGLNFAKSAYSEAKKLLANAKPAAEKPAVNGDDPAEKDTKRSEDQLSALTEGQKAARSPKGGSGSSNLTVEELVAMSDEDFKKYATDDNLKKLMP